MNAPTDRTQFLGSSDMAAVLGLSPWKTALDVYFEKRGEQTSNPDPEKAKLFRRGKRLEPVICEMLTEERGLQIIARNQRYHDAQYPFLACELDAEAEVDGERTNVECKTVHPFTAWKYGDEGTDEIPVDYAAQAMFSMMITGRRRCLFGVLVGADNLLTYELARDDETIAEMRGIAVRFWQDHVLAGKPPAPRTLEDVCHLFRRDAATQIEASPEILSLVEELERTKEAVKAAEDRQIELKYEIGRFMLGAGGIVLENGGKLRPGKDVKPGTHLLTRSGQPLLKVNLQQQNRIDTDSLRRKHPEIAAACSKAISFYRFDSPRK